MRLTEATSWEMESVEAMCTTAAGNMVVRTEKEIQVLDRMGASRTTYNNICDQHPYGRKCISEMSVGKYIADLCRGCDEIRVVDMATYNVYRAYSPSSTRSLHAMCSGPGEGSLLVWDNRSEVIQLQWDESTKKLDEVRQVQVPWSSVYYMCYMPHTDLLILSLDYFGHVVQAVKLQGGAGQPPVWQLQGEVLGKEMKPQGVSCDNEGHLYIADGHNSRVLLVNGTTGQAVQELLWDAGLDYVLDVCCMSNQRQLLVNYYDHPTERRTLKLYNVTLQ